MKKKIKTLLYLVVFIFIILPVSFAQNGYLQGRVLSVDNIPVSGASVVISGLTSGTSTDSNGFFILKISDQKKLTLVVTSIGYSKKEVEVVTGNGPVNIFVQLEEEALELDELIVSGVFDKRKRIESSIAITTIKKDELERIIPNSAAELLRLVPGVFVNSARGELINSIFSRGMVLDGSYYYVSIQEDGLPVIPFSGTLGASAFLRADVSLQKIEAVRGGSASILGVNAPGGIFNFISKTGTNKFEGNIVSRVGLEGNGKNPYYKQELSFSGPLLKDSSWTYFLGGHYRYANGAKYPGYPLSRGGQVRGNILKSYSSGSIKLNVKWLDDRSSSFEFTPSRDFNHPHPSGNFDNTSSVLIPAVHVRIPSVGEGIRAVDFNSKDLVHLQDKSVSLNWEQRLNKSWKMQHAIRLSSKSSETAGTVIVYPFQVNSFLFFALNNLLGNAGKYRFFDARSGQNYGTVTHTVDFTQPDPFIFNSDLHLPGNEVSPNSLFFTPVNYDKRTVHDFVYQGFVTKTFKKMKFTGGLYLSNGRYKAYTASLAQGYTTIENKPHLVAIEYAPEGGGLVKKITDENGIGLYGPAVYFNNDIRLSQNALFFGHQWDITPKLNFDWGFRYEWFSVDNTFINITTLPTPSPDGGIDHDPLTVYDNNLYTANAPVRFKKRLSTFSISGGLNYKVNDHLAYYARYSLGNRTPDIGNYINNETAASVVKEQAQQTVQFEGGIKYETDKIRFAAIPFISILSNVPQTGFGSDTGSLSSYYPTPVIYNKVHTIGIELEGTIKLLSHFNIRANAVFQQFYSDKFQFYDVGLMNGSQDDSIIDRSGKKISDMAAPVIFNITPSYFNKKWYADINMYYLGKRAANTSETFYLNAFTQFDVHVAYAINKNISIQAAINNLFNYFGVMEWTAPVTDGFPFTTFSTEAFTPDKRRANPDANYFTIGIQPRSYFLTLSVKF